jgi:ribosome-associated translation inhibitor RaiA
VTRARDSANAGCVATRRLKETTTMNKFRDEKQKSLRENMFHVGAGFVAKERPHVLKALSTLAPHLGRWDPSQVDIEVTLQDRGGQEQRVTLRTSLPGRPQLVAVADNPDLTRAVCDAKRELIRQLEHQKSAREPMRNRRLRNASIRYPDTSAPPENTDLAARYTP